MIGKRLMSAGFARTERVLAVSFLAGGLYVSACAPHASALPPGFPNLDDFASAPTDDYIGSGPKGPKRFVSFSTPYNIECRFAATVEPVPPGNSQGISCDGDIPGRASGPTAAESCAIGTARDWGASGFRLDRELTNCPPGPFNAGSLLGAGHKVSYQNVTCAVVVTVWWPAWTPVSDNTDSL
jgi:hypothetical protein